MAGLITEPAFDAISSLMTTVAALAVVRDNMANNPTISFFIVNFLYVNLPCKITAFSRNPKFFNKKSMHQGLITNNAARITKNES